MKTDIKEKDGNYLLDIELPGYGKENVSAELKDGYLTISAKKEESKEEKDEEGNFYQKRTLFRFLPKKFLCWKNNY